MATIFAPYYKYLSLFILIVGVLYQYEIPKNSSLPNAGDTFILTKAATLSIGRAQAYKIIADIDKYPLWYPNVARVEHVLPDKSSAPSLANSKYRLITKFPVFGNVSSAVVIHTAEQPNKFVFSVDSWLLEKNSIVLKPNPDKANSTRVEWTVYTERRSALFQYVLFPFARFYKNQLVREALFTLVMQIRDL